MNAQAKSTQGARDEVGKVLAKIVVMGSNGAPYDGPVNATLISASAKVFLNRVGKFYHTTSIEPGSYQLELTALSAGEVFDPQTIRITQAEETYFAYLGNKQPRYQIGQSLVPLKPRSDLVAVTFDGKRPTAEIFSKLDELFAQEK